MHPTSLHLTAFACSLLLICAAPAQTPQAKAQIQAEVNRIKQIATDAEDLKSLQKIEKELQSDYPALDFTDRRLALSAKKSCQSEQGCR